MLSRNRDTPRSRSSVKVSREHVGASEGMPPTKATVANHV